MRHPGLMLFATATAFLLGCSKGKHDGMYLVTLTLKEDTSDPDNPYIGQSIEGTAELYRTTEDLLALSMFGYLMTGTGDGDGMDVALDTASIYSAADCERWEQRTTLKWTATYTDDLGLDGTLTYTDSESSSNCELAGDDASATQVYDGVAILVSGNNQKHVGDGIAWGYLPSGGGGYY